jgi:hypothetical protein
VFLVFNVFRTHCKPVTARLAARTPAAKKREHVVFWPAKVFRIDDRQAEHARPIRAAPAARRCEHNTAPVLACWPLFVGQAPAHGSAFGRGYAEH